MNKDELIWTKMTKDRKKEKQKDRKTEKQKYKMKKKTERKKEGMTKRPNDRKTEIPRRAALLVKMNETFNGDLKMNCKEDSHQL